MLEVYKFPKNYLPLWHIGARMAMGAFTKYLAHMNKGRILDIGAGGGCNSLTAIYMGFNVTSIDISENSLKSMQDIANQMNIYDKLDVIIADCYRLPVPNESYDYVIASHIIEHLDHPKLLLQEIERVLKTDGILLLSCPSPHHWMRLIKHLGFNPDPADHKVIGYSEQELKSFLPGNFVVKSVDYQGRILESNFMDIQTVLSDLTGLKANPVDSAGIKHKRTKTNGSLFLIAYIIKEIILLFWITLCKTENIFLSRINGSMISLEIKKIKAGKN